MIAGAFLRQKLVRTAVDGTARAGIVIGLGIGMVFYVVFPQWIGFGWGVVAYGVTATVLWIAARHTLSPTNSWNLENLAKGVDAETRVGQVIERAITAEHCAVAHSVTEIAKVGDIDHIVATPRAVWVIETKYKKVPEDLFDGVLRRIAANTRAVRQCSWLPEGTPVRGCLVLAYQKKLVKTKYKAEGELITAYTTTSLSKEMESEALEGPSLDGGIVEEIWTLNPLK